MEYKEICLRDKIGEFLCEFAEKDNRIYGSIIGRVFPGGRFCFFS